MRCVKLIAGSGRSGTTWVQDALAEVNGLRPVFEPLHPAVSDVGRRYAYRTLTADEDHPELEQFLGDVCRGTRYRMWTTYRQPGGRILPPLRKLATVADAKREYRRWNKLVHEWPSMSAAGRRVEPLVKCIRANLMLDWLAKRCSCKIVLVVRHPGAVVESQFRLGHGPVWDPEPVLDRYRRDERLHELTGGRYRSLLARRLSRIEALATNWVIENQWAIEQAPASGITVVHYEELKASHSDGWARICRALELQKVPSSSLIARPSQQSSNRSAVEAGPVEQEARWQKGLSHAQMAQIQGVLDEAGFAGYRITDAGAHSSMRTLGRPQATVSK